MNEVERVFIGEVGLGLLASKIHTLNSGIARISSSLSSLQIRPNPSILGWNSLEFIPLDGCQRSPFNPSKNRPIA